ncbi:MAG: hypothetical protein GY822_28770 [Deltaproteobacteria bacterium]|nr:hypothetical protein [Deltaproteobacteria bacterium]
MCPLYITMRGIRDTGCSAFNDAALLLASLSRYAFCMRLFSSLRFYLPSWLLLSLFLAGPSAAFSTTGPGAGAVSGASFSASGTLDVAAFEGLGLCDFELSGRLGANTVHNTYGGVGGAADAVRQRVLGNIAASRAARASSNFGTHVLRETALRNASTTSINPAGGWVRVARWMSPREAALWPGRNTVLPPISGSGTPPRTFVTLSGAPRPAGGVGNVIASFEVPAGSLAKGSDPLWRVIFLIMTEPFLCAGSEPTERLK